MIFHVSNLNVRVLEPLTHVNSTQTVGRFDVWVTSKTNWPSFCLILKLFHAMDSMFRDCMVVNIINALSAKWSITEHDYFRLCCLGFFLAWSSLFIFRYKCCCNDHFPGFSKYIFPQLQTRTALSLSAVCTDDSCASNILSNFWQPLSF